jgi:MYXO-CTERM domain-containing protein
MASTWRLAAALAVCGSVMAAARPAEACSPPPELALFPDLGTGVMTDVPTDGVIAFRASTYGGLDDALALLTIEVTQDGLPIEGAIETIDLATRDDASVEAHDIIVVWRPAAALEAEASYLATITTTDAWDSQGTPIVDELEVTTAAGPAGDGLEASFAAPELSAVSSEAGRRVCCNDEACGAPVCAAQEIADLATLTADVVAGEGPMLSQTYLRAYAGQPGALEEIAVLGIAANADGATIQRSFVDAADEYCLQLERVSLIDGSVTQHDEQCVAHGDLQLASAPNPDFIPFAEACSAPFWQDTNEPWIPGEDDSGGSESEGSDSEGSGSEGGEESGDASGDATGGEDDDASGCACNVDDRSSIAPALALFVLALGARRRTRRARQDSNLRHPA